MELWRMTPTESGRYRPDYIYYLYDSSPIFFGKVKSDPLYGFPDHGILFDHPEGFTADSIEAEYFCERWVPSRPLPFEVGDMVEFDLRPFGPLRTACVIGDQGGHVTTEDTKVLYRDYISDRWRLVSLSNLERELQGGSCESASSLRPSFSIYGRLSSASTSGLPEEDDLMQVRGYLLEREGFADRRARRSVCLQRDWEFSFGTDGLVSDEQLVKLLQEDGRKRADDSDSMRLL